MLDCQENAMSQNMPRALMHGTTVDNALSILCDGEINISDGRMPFVDAPAIRLIWEFFYRDSFRYAVLATEVSVPSKKQTLNCVFVKKHFTP